MKSFIGSLGLGATAGVLSGLVGIGGGIIIVPALVYFFSMDQNVRCLPLEAAQRLVDMDAGVGQGDPLAGIHRQVYPPRPRVILERGHSRRRSGPWLLRFLFKVCEIAKISDFHRPLWT